MRKEEGGSPAQLVGHVEVCLHARLLRQTLQLIDKSMTVVFERKPELLFQAEPNYNYLLSDDGLNCNKLLKRTSGIKDITTTCEKC